MSKKLSPSICRALAIAQLMETSIAQQIGGELNVPSPVVRFYDRCRSAKMVTLHKNADEYNRIAKLVNKYWNSIQNTYNIQVTTVEYAEWVGFIMQLMPEDQFKSYFSMTPLLMTGELRKEASLQSSVSAIDFGIWLNETFGTKAPTYAVKIIKKKKEKKSRDKSKKNKSKDKKISASKIKYAEESKRKKQVSSFLKDRIAKAKEEAERKD